MLHELVADADVFVTNLLPSARQRFRIDVDGHRRRCSPTSSTPGRAATAPKGPEAESGGFDHTDFWARTGIAHAASMVSDEFVPQAGPALGDLTSGGFLAGGIAAALLRRERTGQGAVVDVSLLSSGIWAFAPGVVASTLYDIDGIPRRRHRDQPNPLVGGVPHRRRAGDLPGGGADRQSLRELLHRDRSAATCSTIRGSPPARIASPRRACSSTSSTTTFAAHDLDHWRALLPELQTPWTIVQTAREAAVDAQVDRQRLRRPGRGRSRRPTPWRPAPPSSTSSRSPLTPASRPRRAHRRRCCSTWARPGTRSSS